MAITKVTSGLISADASSVDLNIDAGTLYIDATNNRVGIGTTSPTTALDVTGTATMDGLTVDGATTLTHSGTTLSVDRTGGATALIELKQAGTIRGYLGADSTKSLIVFNNSAAEKFSVSNTGIDVTGTATMDGLTVNSGAANTTVYFSNSGTPYATWYNDTNGVSILSADAGNTGIATRLQFNVGGVQALRLTEGGDIAFYEDTGTTPKLYWDASTERLGIGTTSPIGDFTISNAGAEGIEFFAASGGNVNSTQHYNRSGSVYVTNKVIAADHHFFIGGSEAMRIGSGGNLVVGTTSNPSGQRLHLESAGQFGQIGLRHSSATSGKFWYVGPASNNTFAIYNQTPAGVYLTDGATSWTGASDLNLKENIVELTGALDKVKDYRCVEYNFIADETNSKKIGFIAQDWQEDYSQVVSQDPDGNLGIQYTETIPVLLKAIQEQQALIEAQATTITDLTTRIETLENA